MIEGFIVYIRVTKYTTLEEIEEKERKEKIMYHSQKCLNLKIYPQK